MKRFFGIVLVLLVLGGVAVGIVYGRYSSWLDTPVAPDKTNPFKVSIPPGSSFGKVLTILEEHGVIDEPLYFRYYAKGNADLTTIKAGTYFIEGAMTPRQILLELIEGSPAPHLTLRIKEGATVWEVAEEMSLLGLGTYGDILALMASPEAAAEAGVPKDAVEACKAARKKAAWATCFEGYLFPETYHVKPGAAPDKVLAKVVGQFHKVRDGLAAAHTSTLAALEEQYGITDHDVVIIASLVEKEMAVLDEAPVIASVFYNRLKKGMKLQTDPTLVYHPALIGVVPTPTHRKDSSNPYNTYSYKALPPGPIASPSKAALEGAMSPATGTKGGYLFFVAKRDGTGRHHFSKTGAEHEKAVKKYLKGK